MSEIYFKLVADLSLTELLQAYDSLDNKHLPAQDPISDKKSVILNIFKLEPDFFKNDDLNETVRQTGPNVKKDEDGSMPQQPSSQKRKTPKSCSKSTDEDTVRKSDSRQRSITLRCQSKLGSVIWKSLADAGANIIKSLDDDEMVDWKLFKRNLISSLGKSDEFYKNQFHKYQRGSDSFDLCGSVGF
jgi:hypothetical protein